MKNLKNFIKKLLLKENIKIYGFTDPFLPENEKKFLINWIKNGYHANMKWMERSLEKRLDLRKVWGKVKSVLVVAIPYKKINLKKYKIAGYAFYVDYHKFIYKKLKRIMEKTKENFKDFEYKIYVDTGPILERAFARKAGLGFIGKNTMLISFKKGSYMLLGVALMNKRIEYDREIEKNFCGKCRRCIESCPTEAIIEPFLIDSRKCISYHTIENRGEIPEEIKKRMNGWIFGCDICQEVCPWNRNPIEPMDFPLHPFIKDFTSKEFKKNPDKFLKNSPLKRAKLEGIMRNISIAESNLNPDP